MAARTPRILMVLLCLAAGAGMAPRPAGADPPAQTPGPAHPVVVENDASQPVPVTGEVTVTSPTASPLLVQEQRVPLQFAASFDNWGTEDFRNFSEDVPEGKVLVVQHVSARAGVPIGQAVVAEVSLILSSGLASHPIVMTKQGTFDSLDVYVGSTPLIAYADGPGGVLLVVRRNSTTGIGGRVEVSLSGYLIDE